MSQKSSVGMMDRLLARLPRNLGPIPGICKRLFSSPLRPHRLWGPSAFLFIE